MTTKNPDMNGTQQDAHHSLNTCQISFYYLHNKYLLIVMLCILLYFFIMCHQVDHNRFTL